jgi:hypothetical protein
MQRSFLNNPFNAEEVAMNVSQSITNFMDYQKMNSGEKYGQELQVISGKV